MKSQKVNYYLNECVYKHPFDFKSFKYNSNFYANTTNKLHEQLTKQIATHVSVNCDNITITSGGDAAIILCTDNLFKLNSEGKVNKKRYVYKYEPSYRKIEELCDITYKVETPLVNKHKSMEFYDPPDNSIIYICNPCNPTGELWEESEYLLLCKKYPKCNIIIDEAYMEFTDINAKCSNVNVYKNLFYIRTFSKLFGMAGMRLGYLVHHKQFKHNYSFKNVITLSKQMGSEILNNKPFYENICQLINNNKKELSIESGGNFIFVRLNYDKIEDAKKELIDNDINARYGYDNGIRITIHPHMNNLLFIKNFINKYNIIDVRTLYTPIDDRIKLLNLFKLFINVFKYEWWADGGTRLGAERQQCMIPWDDDIDVAIMDLDDYTDFEKNLSQYFNLKRNRTDRYYQICDKAFDGHPNQTLHIDIFPQIYLDNKIVCSDERFRDYSDNCMNIIFNSVDDIFPLRQAQFYDMMIPVPKCKIPDKFNSMEIRNNDGNLLYYSNKVVMT